MTARRPPSQRNTEYADRHALRHLRSMAPGAEGGRLVEARPTIGTETEATFGTEGGSGAGAAVAQFENTDIFDLATDGPQDLALTKVPIEKSLHVELQGLKLDRRTEWSLSGTTLSLLSTDPLTGMVVTTEYAYLGEQTEVLAPSGGAYPDEVIADSPIAYWRLNEPSGTAVADFTGHGHDGTTAAGSGSVTRAQSTLLTSGNGGVYSTKFEDYGARVDVPSSSAFHTSEFTLEFFTSKGAGTFCPVWHHPGRVRVLMAGAAIDVFFWASGAWSHKWRFSGLVGGDDSSNHRVTITWDGADMDLWMDGALDSGTSMGAATLPVTSSGGPEFGDGDDGVNDGSAFRLQEYAYYGTALDPARIAAHEAVR